MAPKHPLQPLVMDGEGVVRFKKNRAVRFLVDFAAGRECTLNELAAMGFDTDDWTQLMQLVGYSVSGFGDLSSVDRAAVDAADHQAAALLRKIRRKR